jgi:hypothetical protein
MNYKLVDYYIPPFALLSFKGFKWLDLKSFEGGRG